MGYNVKLVDIDRDTSTSATTNNAGLYTFPSVKPGRYRMEITAAGFRVDFCCRNFCRGNSRQGDLPGIQCQSTVKLWPVLFCSSQGF
jgi:hypothetical protein